ncbi:unnamed protein product [Paramecium pentaurelia]|uniref:Uncharacterized protein n=1 Tax=Paramecium pentaurelia TaxID=43138 RepID=A0A8S1TDK4_9CILI|nr:unnamed protein product [Paramecium pentaurelia]
MIQSNGEFDFTNQAILKLIKNEKENKQEDICIAIAIDYKQQIMASGCKNIIKLWNFQIGQISQITQLEGHKDLITCLIFSKKSRSLISASQDCQIRLWKQNINESWSSSQSSQEHLGCINCIIMNYSEELLFTGSSDLSIKVWKINIDLNELKLLYQLNKHTKNIIGLTLTPNENVLASSGLDNQIIIWCKSQQESGCRLSFINDNKLIWVSRSNEVMHIFQAQDGIFRENTKQKLNLNCSPMCHEQFNFPIYYNQESKIIALKNKFHFYIIKEQLDGHFQILQSIELLSTTTYGTVTNDGRFIVLWNNVSKSYQIYELTMK